MQRRIVFAVLGVPLAIAAGYAAFFISGELYFRLGIRASSWMMRNLGPLQIWFCVSAIALLLFPGLGYTWGKRRDLAAQADLPTRHAYCMLGFPLALAAGGMMAIFIAVLSAPPGPTSWGANFAPMIVFVLFTPVAMLVFPVIGYVWGSRKDHAALISQSDHALPR
jgi:hypothetical protein